VHTSRTLSIRQEELPVYLVSAGPEEIEGTLPALSRLFQVIVEIVVAGPEYDDVIDAQLVAVEQALTGDLSQLVESFLPANIDINVSVDGATPIARARLVYEARYRTNFNDPELSI
jgi:hypothetical protein